jgi:hypothetical protein
MLTADRATRTLTADPLLPFGEQGRTNLGRVTASRGRLAIPKDVSGLVLNRQHERNAPIAKFTSVTETPTGLRATFHVPNTSAGDDLLAEVENGLRTGVSVEIDNPVIRDGQLLGGTLTGAAAVVDPAFPSAQLVAADAGPLPAEIPPDEDSETVSTEVITINGIEYVRKTTSSYITETAPKDPNAAAAAGQEAAMADTQTVTPVDTTQPLAAGLPRSIRSVTGKGGASLFAALAGADGPERMRLTAALDQIVQADGVNSQNKQWIGEVYSSRTYQRRIASLMQHSPLTSLNVVGWKFGVTPTVADGYAGFPAQPNSTANVATVPVTGTAARIAGAAAIDRAFVDFSVPEFWAGYYRECTNDYERKIDAAGLAGMVAGATAAHNSLAANPANVSRAACMIVDGAMAVINAERDIPAFAIVGSDLYRSLLLTRADDVLEYLSMALGLAQGDLKGFVIRPSAAASMTAKVLVGTSTATTLYELAGASPIRVETVNVGTGGIETGVFGYHFELVNDALGLALVDQVA